MSRNQVALLLVAVAVVAFLAASAGGRFSGTQSAGGQVPAYAQPNRQDTNRQIEQQNRRLREIEREQCRAQQQAADARAKANGSPFGAGIVCTVDPFR